MLVFWSTTQVLCIFVGLLEFDVTFAQESQNLEINLSLGKVKGSLMTSRLGKKIYSFRGIRYAEPPVDELRFQVPVPVKPWRNVFDASIEGPSCPQPNNTYISEDCLRLNVYSNELPTESKKVKKPVIVFFHPGGFYISSSQSLNLGPQYLLDKEIVLVTVNYRLGALGFISTGDSIFPGNLGLKDQVIALRWIKQNIRAFGGDPNLVTITGYSAGAWSVSLHLVSPMSKGLFHRAITMSGSAVHQLTLPKDQKELAIKQAEILNCPTDSINNIFKCLKTKSAQEFADSLPKFFIWYGNPILIWTPVVEPKIPGIERFLPDDPAKLIKAGKFEQVPFIGGFNKDEFSAMILLAVVDSLKLDFYIFEQWNKNWDYIAPRLFLYERNTTRSRKISSELKKFYHGNFPITVFNLQGIANLFRDSIIGYSGHRLINLLAASSSKPVYYYHFIYQGRYSSIVNPVTRRPYGVTHNDDLMYLFYTPPLPFLKQNDPETRILERMITIWENFAKTGEPIPENNQLFGNITWKRFTPQHKRYLEINNRFTMKNGLINSREMEFWDRLFPLQ